MKKHYLFFLLMFSSLFATLQGQTNNSPTFTSTAITTVDENTAYSYIITSTDADGDNQTISATTLPSWLTLTNTVTVSTFAGGSWGNTDGTGTAAKFKYPSGVAVDDSGNVYVADYNNNLIRKISPEGVVSTLAGNGYGFANGTGTAAKFMHPYGLAVDGSGTVYVAEYSGNRIRKISPEGVVSTFAGSTSGYADGTGTAAQFSGPKDLAVDGSGTVYVADSNNNLIRKISPQGVVSTFAGSLTSGSSDGTGTAAQFSKPYGVAVDGSGTLYVADTNNNLIRKISPAGVVSTLASQLNTPYGVAVDDSGTVYVTDYNKHRIRKISPDGVVSTLAGNENGVSGSTSGEGTVARFKYPYGLAADSSGTVYVADSYNSSIRKVIQKTVLTGTPTSANVGPHSVVLEVSDGNGGTMQQSFSITVVDTTPPVFENSTPNASSVAQTSFTLNTDIDGAGTIYYVVVSDGATAPTAAEVKAGTASGGGSAITHGNAAVSAGGFTNDFSVAGLTANTAYDVYVVAQDDVSTPNLQAAVTKIDVTTTAQIVITEIMYNSPESGVDTAEFIEFYNAGSTPVNMVGYSIQDAVVYTFGNVTINAGDYYVLTTNLVSFAATYGSSADAQWTSGDLSNGGEVIELKNSLGNQVDYVNYDDSTPWPTGSTSGKPDGGGASIVLYDISSDNNDGTNWRASINNLGITVNGVPITASPGVKNVIRPEVTSVTVPTATTYVTGQDLVFTVNFNKNITVNTTGGIPQLAITIGATVRQAVYQSGSGSGAIVFRYAILAGDLDTDGITVGTLAANGGTFQDSVSNDANLTLNSVGATNGVLVDALAPVLNSSVPTDNAIGVLLSQNIKLTFSENINKGTGNIVIYDASNDTAVETIAVTSSHVSISNHIVTINPTADLLKSKNYYIQIANTAFKDASSNYFAGILDKTTFSFATELKTTPTITFEDFTKTYGDTAVTLAATSNSTGSISYNIVTGGSGTATLSGTNNATLIPGNVGTVKIKATQVTDANYLQTEKEITLTITKKAITITADAKSKVYGATDPSLTYQITTGSLETGDVLTGSLTRIAGEDFGTYAIGSTLANANYDITFVSKDLTIAKKAITITADAKSKVYGATDPSLTYQITTGSLETGDVLTGSLTRIAGEDVGAYTIGSTLANTNYSITFVSKELTIAKKAITITADAKSKVYGAIDPSLTYQITAGSLETVDVLTGSLTRIAGEDVGAYTIGSTLANTNYSITFVSKELTIVKKPITITADAKSKVYGATDPSLTYQITTGSLETGDVLTGGLTRVAGEDVGAYAISSTLANTNYDITFVSKKLTIAKKAITITADAKSKVYGDSDPSLTYQITTGSLETGDVLTGGLTRIAGEDVGVYALGSTLANTNYDITFVSKDLTIVKKGITITADAKSKVYGATDPSLT
ncbi:MBG domain-containing protein, partial [Polaribacter pacificus]